MLANSRSGGFWSRQPVISPTGEKTTTLQRTLSSGGTAPQPPTPPLALIRPPRLERPLPLRSFPQSAPPYPTLPLRLSFAYPLLTLTRHSLQTPSSLT